MDPFEEPGKRRSVSVPTLLAWLSVCLLAAAWGRSLDAQLQAQWSTLGLYGLVASVGLGMLEKARKARLKTSRQRALQARTDFGFARISEQGAAHDAIRSAVRRVTTSTGCELDEVTIPKPPRKDERRSQQRSERLRQLPMEVTTIIDHDDLSCDLSEPQSCTLRDISSRGISFQHQAPIEGRIVVLTVRLPEARHLSFVAEALWTEATDEGFVTGGTILDVGIPDDVPSANLLLEPAVVASA